MGLAFVGVCPAGEEPHQENLKIVSAYKAVFTDVPKRIPTWETVDAPLLGNGDTLVAFAGEPAAMKFYIGKNDLWIMKVENDSRPQPLARLDVGFPQLKGASYYVEQDLARAITTGRFEKDGKTLMMETAVAATKNLLWIKFTATGGSFTGLAGLELPGQGAAASVAENDRKVNIGRGAGVKTGYEKVVAREFTKDMFVPASAACALRVVNCGEEFTVAPGQPVLIVAATASRFEKENFREAALASVADFRAEELPALQQAHEAWWRAFWDKSFVQMPDKFLEQRYYLSQYVLASASRLKDFPPGLFGWVTAGNPRWNGDYHMNYNHVAPFYGLYAANHLEQADPCHVPILANADRARKTCRKTLGIEGILQDCGIGPKGSMAWSTPLMQKSNSSYSCVPLAFRWYATYDLDYARQAYPFVRDVALFWENWLKFEPTSPSSGTPSPAGLRRPGEGRYVIYQDAVHELSGDDMNPIVSLALVKMVMNLSLDMSKELGVDAGRREKWEHIRDHISAFPTCTVADLPEMFRPKDKSLWTLPIFRYTEKGIPWWRDNTLGIQHIFPAGGIGLDSSPELLERARNQVRVLGRWGDFNGMNSIYAAAARVGYDPKIILNEMHATLAKIGLPNGMIAGNPHGMEHQSIVPNAIQEMLMQSHEGVIRLFPCWPNDQNACFGTLRARGAFLVSAELKNGIVSGVKIVSEKGKLCTVQNPWPGKKVRIIRSGIRLFRETAQGTRFTFKTKPGEVVELQPKL